MSIRGEFLTSGWGVVRLKPWHLAGVFRESIEAKKLAALLGPAYVVKYGERAAASGEFVFTYTTNPL